tara:strand:+ start:928 stop:1155 length:228 start_codon:yes stop_codon:yes gene_type:complete
MLTVDVQASFLREVTSIRALDEDSLNIKIQNPQISILDSYESILQESGAMSSLVTTLLSPFSVYVDARGLYRYQP